MCISFQIVIVDAVDNFRETIIFNVPIRFIRLMMPLPSCLWGGYCVLSFGNLFMDEMYPLRCLVQIMLDPNNGFIFDYICFNVSPPPKKKKLIQLAGLL